MSNAMKNRLSAAKTGAGESVKAKSTRAPLIDIAPALQVVPDDTLTQVPETTIAIEAAPELSLKQQMAAARSSSPTALAVAVNVLDDEHESPATISTPAPRSLVTPGTVQPSPVAVTQTQQRVTAGEATHDGPSLVDELCAPPAPMGTVGESKLITVPVTEEAYALMQRLDRQAALQLGRPINRTRLITKALETVLANPELYAGEYLTAQQSGTTWKRRTQGRIPTELANKLPALRYTGSHRQSAGMMVSIALGEYLEKVEIELVKR